MKLYIRKDLAAYLESILTFIGYHFLLSTLTEFATKTVYVLALSPKLPYYEPTTNYFPIELQINLLFFSSYSFVHGTKLKTDQDQQPKMNSGKTYQPFVLICNKKYILETHNATWITCSLLRKCC